MKTGRRALVAACVLTALIACQSAAAMTVALTGRDSGRALYLRKGDVVQVTLAENQSTPYRWAFKTRPSARVLRLTKSVYVPSPAPPGIVGRGGHHLYTFKAVGTGTTSVQLVLRYLGAPNRIGGRFNLQIRPG